MEKIDFDANSGHGNCADFVILYANDGQPWLDYPVDEGLNGDITVPTCLMLLRSDGQVGFVGGMRDPGETSEECVRREALEEIGFDRELTLQPLAAFREEDKDLNKYAYAAQLPYVDLRQITENGIKAEHYGSEISALILAQLVDYEALTGSGGGLQNLLKLPFVPSAREELSLLIQQQNLMDPESFARCCEKAGFSAAELLNVGVE